MQKRNEKSFGNVPGEVDLVGVDGGYLWTLGTRVITEESTPKLLAVLLE
jgi:hypothetical protein